MELPITTKEFDLLKSRDKVRLTCLNCQGQYFLTKHRIQDKLLADSKTGNKLNGAFCGSKCMHKYSKKALSISVKCDYCNKIFTKIPSQLTESGKNFCCSSHSAKYHNKTRIVERIIINCKQCNKEFKRASFYISDKQANFFCSKDCSYKFQGFEGYQTTKCDNCQKDVIKRTKVLRVNKYNFCGKSCQAIFANKTYNRKSRFGINKSKAETLLVNIIHNDFPSLAIEENNRSILNGLELDIYIPEKNIGIELNGPCHYIPIFGEEELKKTQNKDVIKKQRMQDLKMHFFQIKIMGAGKKLQAVLEYSYLNCIKPLL